MYGFCYVWRLAAAAASETKQDSSSDLAGGAAVDSFQPHGVESQAEVPMPPLQLPECPVPMELDDSQIPPNDLVPVKVEVSLQKSEAVGKDGSQEPTPAPTCSPPDDPFAKPGDVSGNLAGGDSKSNFVDPLANIQVPQEPEVLRRSELRDLRKSQKKPKGEAKAKAKGTGKGRGGKGRGRGRKARVVPDDLPASSGEEDKAEELPGDELPSPAPATPPKALAKQAAKAKPKGKAKAARKASPKRKSRARAKQSPKSKASTRNTAGAAKAKAKAKAKAASSKKRKQADPSTSPEAPVEKKRNTKAASLQAIPRDARPAFKKHIVLNIIVMF